MAAPVESYPAFVDLFERVKDKADLFAFLLFDDRPSHSSIKQFAEQNFSWLNALASAAEMYLFLPISLEGSAVENPSLKIAAEFGVIANRLPGIVFFTLYNDKTRVSSGTYFPLKPDEFKVEITHVEAVVADLFSIIQEERRESGTPQRLLANVTNRLNSLARREQVRPIGKWLLSVGESLKSLPYDLAKAMVQAYGQGLAGR